MTEQFHHIHKTMNLCLSIALRPSSFVFLLAYGALIVLVSLMPCWYGIVTHMEKRVSLNSENIVSQFPSEIEYSAELLHPMKSSSTNLARFLSSSIDTTNISFSDIETKVAPFLFEAFKTVPHLAQISYIGMEGLFFSYYIDHDKALAMYSNSSSSSSLNSGASNKTLYYIQPVNHETGEVFGEAIISNPSISASWIREAVNISHGFTSLGTKWSNGHDLLFLSSASITRTGVISLGFSATAITDFVTRIISHQGTTSYLATKDGKVLHVEGFQHTHLVISNDAVSFQSVNVNGDLTGNEGNVSCKDKAVASNLNIRDSEYLIHCYPIDIMGIESVYVLAVPQNGVVSFDVNYNRKGLTLLIVSMVMIFIAILSFLYINGRATGREMHLIASLIKQMEATQEAEKKNMNKSEAFAKASHDVRSFLAGLMGLIEVSKELVVAGSELKTNLNQMDTCTQDLLGLLNSILDTSKIEAGKLQLEEEEFDVFRLVEEAVNLYHPVAMKKGVDLVLDPCNGSVIKYARVKGDRGKLKQILCNLLSNAVKFTDEGHIAVRAWAQKPSLQNSIITTNQYSFTKHFSCLFYKKNEAHVDIEAMNSIQQDPCSMDFVFEVDDTGVGIPKEKHKSVFENYVQVKETGPGQGGTGLGLGIVQSLVRLMHGDIGIVDKDKGEKGTCFRFNVHLTVCETEIDDSTRELGDGNQAEGRTIHATSTSPRPEDSCVVLLIASEERRKTSQRFMERLGIKVNVVKEWKHLFYTLIKIKQKGNLSSGKSTPGSTSSHNSLARAKGVVPLSGMDGTEYMPSVFKKTHNGASPGFILIVIDANAGPFSELDKIVSQFKRDLCNPFKVVWLGKPLIRRIIDQNDIVISQPFHGSRLCQVIELLPEYGGAWQSNSSKAKRESTHDHRAGLDFPPLERSRVSPYNDSSFQSVEQTWKGTQQSNGDPSHVWPKAARKYPVHQGETQECGKLLSGKKLLIVEDSALLRKLASATLIPLGATIEQCENGEQAVRLVDEGLARDFPNPPYDYILMDCLMPVMGGLEATRLIRNKEKPYGVRIPIIALTALTDKMKKEDGMDFHIVKPIKREHLLEAIRYIHGQE
ncbi:histidine kinase CKI1-like [Gastrolobium bilobum]|uniref:histidine kinase CKI1-like n=1 Tax=Gastrolobium bilobum TaxID=150636 RepID=UPI002AB28A14|nr:histidine kinase CKI1-like [Gastrolobium bilobum]